MSSGLCLITRGFICNPYEAVVEFSPLVSCDEPVVRQTLEVRPRVRSMAIEEPAQPTLPVTTSAQEVKPIMKRADAPAPPSPDNKPVPHVTIELRPVIKKAEED